jgi:hypothetical protein
MVDQNKIDEIIKRLDILVKISGLNLIQKFKTNKEKIEFLANLVLMLSMMAGQISAANASATP